MRKITHRTCVLSAIGHRLMGCSSLRRVSSLQLHLNECPLHILTSPGSKEDEMTKTALRNLTPSTPGSVLHWAARYDLMVWLFMLGRERAFREKALRLVRLAPGDSVLDVGCGTGTLAIAAKSHVGPTGTVCGIDASPEMIARADKKA